MVNCQFLIVNDCDRNNILLLKVLGIRLWALGLRKH
jgi:hypothetical protein